MASCEQLMCAYGAGDAAAFDQLYTRHKDRLYRFIARAASTPAQADELFQECWMRVIQARHGYQPQAQFSTWLYQIAHRLVIDHYRRQRPELTGDDADSAIEATAADRDHEPEPALSEFEQRRRLQLAINELPAEQRMVLSLRLEQELGLEQIAEITAVGRETVKSRLRYALDKLRERLRS